MAQEISAEVAEEMIAKLSTLDHDTQKGFLRIMSIFLRCYDPDARMFAALMYSEDDTFGTIGINAGFHETWILNQMSNAVFAQQFNDMDVARGEAH